MMGAVGRVKTKVKMKELPSLNRGRMGTNHQGIDKKGLLAKIQHNLGGKS